MQMKKLLPSALAVCLPVVAFGESCIVSGSVIRKPVSDVASQPLSVFEARSLTSLTAMPLPIFESRFYSALAGTLQEFRSDAPVPFLIFIR